MIRKVKISALGIGQVRGTSNPLQAPVLRRASVTVASSLDVAKVDLLPFMHRSKDFS